MRREHDARSIRRALFLTLVLLVTAAASITSSTSRVSAGTGQGFATETAVLPGETLTIDVTTSGVNIGNSTPVATCPVNGFGTDIIIYTCDYLGTGIPAGTLLAQQWTDPTGHPLAGPYSETVTYNASGSGPVASKGLTPCTKGALGTDPNGNTQGWDCYMNSVPMQSPQTLTFYLMSSDNNLLITSQQGLNIQYGNGEGSSDTSLGACPMFNNGTTPTFVEYVSDINNLAATAAGYPGELIDGTQWGSEIKAAFTCYGGSVIPVPSSTGCNTVPTLGNLSNNLQNNCGGYLDFSVTTTSFPTVAMDEFVTYAQPPSPTTQVLNPGSPVVDSINPTSGPAGTSVTFTGTSLIGQVVTFGPNPGHGSAPLGPDRGTKVQFGQATEPADVCSSDGTSCSATVPGGIQPGSQVSVAIVTSAGVSNSFTFTITAGAAPATTSGGSPPAATPTPTVTPKPAATPSPTATPQHHPG